ncbi:MAG: alkaline phosphatase family protein [Candidatus Hydrogenedentales bacterium]
MDKEAIENDTSENAASRYIATQVAECIKEKKPRLTFIHLDLVDHAGHSHVYDSEKYNATVGEADKLVGLIVKGIDDAGIRKNTAIFVVSDHGGIDKGHGGDTPEETIVPWIVSGRGHSPGRRHPRRHQRRPRPGPPSRPSWAPNCPRAGP